VNVFYSAKLKKTTNFGPYIYKNFFLYLDLKNLPWNFFKHLGTTCYNTLIRPIVTYASETWALKENLINKLMIFERKIMRKIVGPTRLDDGQ
jgi:hypothetical protein